MLLYCDTISISVICKVNDDTVNDVALLTCRRWEEPRLEVFERETVIRCETLDVVVSRAVDVAAHLICLAVVDERDALLAIVARSNRSHRC